jgi:hypothetical protein
MSSMMNSVARKEWTPRWGRWTLDAEGEYPTLEIQPYTHSTTRYGVRLFKPGCTHEEYTAWLGHWVTQLHRKSWAAYKDVYMFVDAATDIRGWERAANE